MRDTQYKSGVNGADTSSQVVGLLPANVAFKAVSALSVLCCGVVCRGVTCSTVSTAGFRDVSEAARCMLFVLLEMLG